jgi:hypothetical protein
LVLGVIGFLLLTICFCCCRIIRKRYVFTFSLPLPCFCSLPPSNKLADIIYF